MESVGSMTVNEVMHHLPHRYPFLLIDRVVDCRPGEYIEAIKNVSVNEPFFQGHFPGLPIMPGVLILEALAQATSILALTTQQERAGRALNPEEIIYLLAGIDEARFRRQVVPGETLSLRVEFVREARGLWKFNGAARVGDEVAATAVIKCAGRERTPS